MPDKELTFTEYLESLNKAKSDSKAFNMPKVLQDKLEAMPTTVDDFNQSTRDELYILLGQIEGIETLNRREEGLAYHKNKLSNQYGELFAKKKTKPTGKSPKTIKRNQEIIDKAYQLGKEEIKPGVIYRRLAKEYDLDWETIKKITSADDATPTSLKKS